MAGRDSWVDVIYVIPKDPYNLSRYPLFVISQDPDSDRCEIRSMDMEGDLRSSSDCPTLAEALIHLGHRMQIEKIPYIVERLDDL